MISLGLLEPAPHSPTPEQAIGDTTSLTPTAPDQQSGQPAPPTDNQTPQAISAAIPTSEPDSVASAQQIDTITVETEKYTILLSTLGGGPVSIKLKEYSYPWESNGPIEMLPVDETDDTNLALESDHERGVWIRKLRRL